MIKKFLYVGILATLVDYSIYSSMIYFDILTYQAAIVVGYSAGFIVSFFMTRNYVFKKVKISKLHKEFVIVLFITFLGLLLNMGIVAFMVKAEIDQYTARLVAIGIVFFFNYYLRKGFVYA